MQESNSNTVSAVSTLTEREICNAKFQIYGTTQKPLFLAKDIAEWLEHSDTSMMLKSIDEEEKLIQTILVSGQRRECSLLTEHGLYEVLFLSRKPAAKQFKKEVKHILQELRTTGTVTRVKDSYQIEDPVERAQKWIEEQREKRELKESRDKLIGGFESLAKKVVELAPYKEYVEQIEDSTTLHTANAIASQLKISALALNKKLVESGICYRQGKLLLLSSEFRDKGVAKMVTHKYFDSNGDIQTHDLLKWTEKGRQMIHLSCYHFATMAEIRHFLNNSDNTMFKKYLSV